MHPHVELISSRSAVCSSANSVLHMLVRITAPQSARDTPRPAVNLGLVLDNSSSMEGKKIEFVRQAAIFTVNQMLPGDRVSVTTFNASARTIVPSTPADHKGAIVDRIRRVRTGAKTALHAGRAEGGGGGLRGRTPDGINRGLLLSDGRANPGLSDPAPLAGGGRGTA